MVHAKNVRSSLDPMKTKRDASPIPSTQTTFLNNKLSQLQIHQINNSGMTQTTSINQHATSVKIVDALVANHAIHVQSAKTGLVSNSRMSKWP